MGTLATAIAERPPNAKAMMSPSIVQTPTLRKNAVRASSDRKPGRYNL
jgi:hypothetical protein